MSAPTTRQARTTLVALAFCLALLMTGFVMILPLFARRFDSFGAGVQALSMSDMAFALTSTFAAPFVGMLADRFGRRPVILLSVAAHVLAFGGYLLAASAWQLILLRGLSGVFTAGLVPAITSVVGDVAPQDRRAQWIGIVSGGAAAGWVAGPVLGGWLYDRFGYGVPFSASIVLAAGALLLAVWMVRETQSPSFQPSAPKPSWANGLVFQPVFLLPMLIIFGVMFAYAFISPQFMFYAYDDLGWTSSRLGWVMSAYGLAFMLCQFALGRLSDRLGRKPVLVLGLALFSAQFVGLVIFRDVTWIAASFILAGLGNALYDPALSALVLDLTPPEHTASMLGLKGMAGSLGNMLGPGLLALFAPVSSPRLVFLMAAVLVWVITLATGLGLRLPKAGTVPLTKAEAVIGQ